MTHKQALAEVAQEMEGKLAVLRERAADQIDTKLKITQLEEELVQTNRIKTEYQQKLDRATIGLWGV